MPENKSSPNRLPTIKELAKYIAESGGKPTTKQVAKAFYVDKSKMKELRKRLKKAYGSKSATREPKNRKQVVTDKTPPVMVMQVLAINADGDIEASPENFKHDRKYVPPKIIIPSSSIKAGNAPTVGDRVLAKINMKGKHGGEGRIIRILPKQSTARMLGILNFTKQGGLVEPVNRKDKHSFIIQNEHIGEAEEGELVEVEPLPSPKGNHGMRMRSAKIIRRLGDMNHPGAASIVAIHQYNIRDGFADEVIAEAEAFEEPVKTEYREDLRDKKLITIDGADARDFDDAVFAEADNDTDNKSGWKLIVAIADVAHYVTPGSALDREAFERGNSTYFPDRVVPMLPEALSNGLCSLNPDVDRYCIAAHIWIDKQGNTIRQKFTRAIMRSHGRWTYEDIAQAHNTGVTEPEYVKNLYKAYECLKRHIRNRSPLDINLPEFKPEFDENGNVTAINKRESLESHKLIEAFMIAANVAAAETLNNPGINATFRVHEAPDMAKISTLKDMLKPAGYKLNISSGLNASAFNSLLREAEEKGEASIIHTSVLRSQMQAYYGTENSGHFGLSLKSYTHFTSPIRRYSDLIVHRSLVDYLNLGKSKAEKQAEKAGTEVNFKKVAEHISDTERNSMKAERSAMDRYLAAFMYDRVGAEFAAHISGISNAGFFVCLDENGADGLVPLRSLADDFYNYDQKRQHLVGRRYSRRFMLGQGVQVTLTHADPITGSLRFVLSEFYGRKASDNRGKNRKPYRKKHK